MIKREGKRSPRPPTQERLPKTNQRGKIADCEVQRVVPDISHIVLSRERRRDLQQPLVVDSSGAPRFYVDPPQPDQEHEVPEPSVDLERRIVPHIPTLCGID